tara:strand:+ start:1207 stop:1437 length:231 start_codon:yes stop_codon:yes gene_type:complete
MQDAGYPVKYVFSEKEYGEVLAELCAEMGVTTATKPAELSLRQATNENWFGLRSSNFRINQILIPTIGIFYSSLFQ